MYSTCFHTTTSHLRLEESATDENIVGVLTSLRNNNAIARTSAGKCTNMNIPVASLSAHDDVADLFE